MDEVTLMALVSHERGEKLRAVLESEDTAPVSWREERTLFGSEFFFSGPAELVHQTHAFVTKWAESSTE